MRFICLLLLLSVIAFGQPSMPAWPNSVFYQDISAATVDPVSSQIIASMKASSAGGSGASTGLAWGSGSGNLQIDWSIQPLWLPSGGQKTCANIRPDPNGYYTPDCDNVTGLLFPLPAKGAIEGTNGYGACSGDCHLSVYDVANNLLWESYGSSYDAATNTLTTTCIVIWDLTLNYPSNLRGEQCTSVDAAGFPIAPILGTADEVYSGVINHALRLALPNNMLQKDVYAHPATHASSVLKGTNPSPFYGMRMRLKSSFVNSAFANPEGSNTTALGVIFTALKKYGMFMSDGSSTGAGGIPLIMASDQFSTVKWDDINLNSHSLFSLKVDDFEVVQPLDNTLGTGKDGRITVTFDCVRNQPTPSRASQTCSSSGTGTGTGTGTTTVKTGTSTSTGGTSGTATGTGTGTGTGAGTSSTTNGTNRCEMMVGILLVFIISLFI